jgi:hypothetical protein
MVEPIREAEVLDLPPLFAPRVRDGMALIAIERVAMITQLQFDNAYLSLQNEALKAELLEVYVELCALRRSLGDPHPCQNT